MINSLLQFDFWLHTHNRTNAFPLTPSRKSKLCGRRTKRYLCRLYLDCPEKNSTTTGKEMRVGSPVELVPIRRRSSQPLNNTKGEPVSSPQLRPDSLPVRRLLHCAVVLVSVDRSAHSCFADGFDLMFLRVREPAAVRGRDPRGSLFSRALLSSRAERFRLRLVRLA